MRASTILKRLCSGSGLLHKNRHFSRCPYVCTYNIVHPGNVSPPLPVPPHIQRPNYITNTVLDKLKLKAMWGKPERKTSKQIDRLKDACSLARDILQKAGESVRAGVTTDQIDRLVHEMIIESNAYPSPLMYKEFPKSVCTSVNNVACHGIPDDRPLEDGDIINIDVTVYYNGNHGDTSATFCVGVADSEACHLVETARDCRDEAIEMCGPGRDLTVIGSTISEIAYGRGLDVVPDFCGHGIGEYFHGPPDIIHIENNFKGKMLEGMSFTIEPVITEGKPSFQVLSDGWTAISLDNSRSAQFEHTILVTAHGVEILTA